MIASTRLAKAQRAMTHAKSYGEANQGACISAQFYVYHLHAFAEVFKTSEAPKDGKKLIVVVSSDRGLCGGIHSSVTKYTRRLIKEGNPESPLVVLGDKSKSQLSRAHPNNFVISFNQIGKSVPSFADAATIADFITTSGAEFDSVSPHGLRRCGCTLMRLALLQVAIVYNRFISAMSYDAGVVEVVSEKSLREAGQCWVVLLAMSSHPSFRELQSI